MAWGVYLPLWGQDSPPAVHSAAAPVPGLPVVAGTAALAAAESAAERRAAVAVHGAGGCGLVDTGQAREEALPLAPSAQLWRQTTGGLYPGPQLLCGLSLHFQRKMLQSNADSQATP